MKLLNMIGFQNDASEMAPSGNQIEAERVLANQKARLQHHFDNEFPKTIWTEDKLRLKDVQSLIVGVVLMELFYPKSCKTVINTALLGLRMFYLYHYSKPRYLNHGIL